MSRRSGSGSCARPGPQTHEARDPGRTGNIPATLRGADLRGADLTEANLRGVDLTGAELVDADLTGADLREWATQQAVPHRYIGICSDTTAGRKDEDASLHEARDPGDHGRHRSLDGALHGTSGSDDGCLFTYQSLGIIEQAQREGAPAFELVLCDEAHRATGIEQTEAKRYSSAPRSPISRAKGQRATSGRPRWWPCSATSKRPGMLQGRCSARSAAAATPAPRRWGADKHIPRQRAPPGSRR